MPFLADLVKETAEKWQQLHIKEPSVVDAFLKCFSLFSSTLSNERGIAKDTKPADGQA